MVSLASAGAACPLGSVIDLDPFGSKIGGIPAWYSDSTKPPAPPTCPTCGSILSLLVQMFTPDASPRSLLVFTCPKPECVTSSASWRCYRSQSKPAAAVVAPSVAPAAPVVTWDSPVADTVDDSAGDWGAGGDWATDVSSVSAPTASVPSWSAVVKKSLPPDSPPSVAPLPAEAVASSSSSSCDWSVAAGFTPVELEWFDEPDPDTTVDYLTARAQEMLARYIAEGGDGDDDAEAGAGAGKGGGAEYERVPAAQKHVLKFQERLALAPSQCLRYEFNGEPLWLSAPPPSLPSTIPKCVGCGKTRVFEAQVLATVVNFLVPLVSTPTVVSSVLELDWEEVLIYSCPDSCARTNEEFVFVR